MTANANRAAPAKRQPDRVVVQLDGEPFEYTPPPPAIARLILRSVINDDGHFQGLEVAS
jgi:hypothetical protein